jgi:histidinol dehydrogenase
MPLSIPRIHLLDADASSRVEELRARLSPSGNVVSEAGRRKTIEVFGEPLTPREVVARICGEVQDQGLDAVLRYSERLDGKRLAAAELRVPAAELRAAHEAVEPAFLESVRRIRANLLRFQTAVLHRHVDVELPGGGRLTQRYVPLRRIGICVPGGAAAYPSTLLMTAVPAQAAGVDEIAVVAPPTPFGSYNQHLLATCFELGVSEVYRVGGAQAVAALAYGAGNDLRPVDKIVGPGNLFVALAKQHVYGQVDIDSIAGPSEVVVVADETTPAAYVAADLIAQAEHAPGSSILITWHPPLIQEVVQCLEEQLANLERGELARESLEAFGALIEVADRQQGAALAEQLATEHLHLQCARPRELLGQIRSAGAIFIGPHSPVAVGDYAAGPSHVLPTGATARWASGLSSNDFLRAGSVIECTAEDLELLADDIVALARIEGLTAHAGSVTQRTTG